MEIHDDEIRFVRQRGDRFIDAVKRIAKRFEIDRAEDVHNADTDKAFIEHGKAAPGTVGFIVGGAADGKRIVEIIINFPPPEGVIPAGDKIDACREQLFGGVGRHAVALRRVFAVGDTNVDLFFAFKRGERGFELVTARLRDHVADKQ